MAACMPASVPRSTMPSLPMSSRANFKRPSKRTKSSRAATNLQSMPQLVDKLEPFNQHQDGIIEPLCGAIVQREAHERLANGMSRHVPGGVDPVFQRPDRLDFLPRF